MMCGELYETLLKCASESLIYNLLGVIRRFKTPVVVEG